MGATFQLDPRPKKRLSPGRPVLAVAFHAVVQHPPGQALQALRLGPRTEEVERDQGRGGRNGTAIAQPDVDHALVVVQEEDRPDGPPRLGIVGLAVDSDRVFLGREPEPVDGRAGPRSRVWPGFLVGQHGQRIRLLEALFVRELVGKVEVTPPEGLRLPPVPVQQLRQQPPTPFDVVHLLDGLGQAGGQGVDQGVHRLLGLGVLGFLRLGD